MDIKDYYAILQLQPEASAEEIKKSFRRLALQYHPDRNSKDPKAAERFQEINEAYEVLSDPAKRKEFDLFRQKTKAQEQAKQQPYEKPDGSFDWEQYNRERYGRPEKEERFSDLVDEVREGFSDFFNQLFSRIRSNSDTAKETQGSAKETKDKTKQEPIRAARGLDFQTELMLTLEEVLTGAARVIELYDKKIRLNVKPGSRDGQQLKIKGKGGDGKNGGEQGDLFVTLKVSPHFRFERDGDNVICPLTIDIYTALLGGTASIPTLEGNISIQIAPCTPNGKLLKLPNKGLPRYGKKEERGDLIVKIEVQIPTQLSPEEAELLAKAKQARG